MSNLMPGPWWIDEKGYSVWGNKEDPFPIVDICCWGQLKKNHSIEEAMAIQRANVFDIAEVPEMVEWIKGMRKAIIAGDSDAITVLLTKGRAILRRIEGEEETE